MNDSNLFVSAQGIRTFLSFVKKHWFRESPMMVRKLINKFFYAFFFSSILSGFDGEHEVKQNYLFLLSLPPCARLRHIIIKPF